MARPCCECPLRMKAKVAWFVLLFWVSIINADDWPQWRGPNRDGISKEKSWSAKWPATGPEKVWNATVGVGYASLAVAKGKVYILGNISDTDNIYCFDANT